MIAKELSGRHIGTQIEWYGRTRSRFTDEPITMITHKKNGRVLVRYGKNNHQWELAPDTEVGEFNDQSINCS